MKSSQWVIALLLLGLAGSGNVWADRGHRGHRSAGGHGHFGVVIGPIWGPWWYPPPPTYYHPPYYPSVVIERATPPPVYIERQAAPPAAAPTPQSNYWYYCDAAKGYYPYVKECPRGWQQVSPQPAGQP